MALFVSSCPPLPPSLCRRGLLLVSILRLSAALLSTSATSSPSRVSIAPAAPRSPRALHPNARTRMFEPTLPALSSRFFRDRSGSSLLAQEHRVPNNAGGSGGYSADGDQNSVSQSLLAPVSENSFTVGPADEFHLNGEVLHIRSGSMHWFRVPEAYISFPPRSPD